MAVYQASYIELEQHENERVNHIVDVLLNPMILIYRNIHVYNERAALQPDGVTWKLHYPNWNEAYPTIVKKNGEKLSIDSQVFNINYEYGLLEVGPIVEGDNVDVSYNFDYFGISTLYGFIISAIDYINARAKGAPGNYTIDNAPPAWDGIIAYLVAARCMERLILDYTQWYGRLIFSLSAQQLEDGSGDILNALQTLKQNFEEMANAAIDNPLLKVGHYIALPTQNYYAGINSGGSGVNNSKNIKYYNRRRRSY